MEYSLMFPQNAEQSYKTLTPESVNDLSIEFLLDALTKQRYERDHIRKIVTRVTDDPEVIRYRCDVFEDFLRFPKLRDAMEELVVKLADLRDVERFQKDQEGSALWSLVNRLREIDDYVTCITAMKNVLDELDVRSEGMLTLRKIISDISADSGFPELRQDIDETFEKVRRIKSITIGVNLDNMLCPSSAGVVSLNDIEYRESSLMRRFMNFADRKDELHHGTDTGSIRVFHPATPVKAVEFSQKVELNDNMTGTRVRTSAVTGADSLSNAIKDTAAICSSISCPRSSFTSAGLSLSRKSWLQECRSARRRFCRPRSATAALRDFITSSSPSTRQAARILISSPTISTLTTICAFSFSQAPTAAARLYLLRRGESRCCSLSLAFTFLPKARLSVRATTSSRIFRLTRTTPSTSAVSARRASVCPRFSVRQPSAA